MYRFSQDPAYVQWLEAMADLILTGAAKESAPARGPERPSQPAPATKQARADNQSVAQAA